MWARWRESSEPGLAWRTVYHRIIDAISFADLEKSDNGVYTCIATSQNGRAIWSANLRLESPTNPNIGFFRSPEPQTYPGPPTRPAVVNKTRNSATITWSRNNKIGSSSLLGYQVSFGFVSSNSVLYSVKYGSLYADIDS